ncbi:ECF transporter S component [uncultured Ruthenibacterium sp.]|uniref:ECF transporter S component n=1 Tax=uncultured Ruthenibacterium sp. TaxID=1905347 RepID=UPI00349EF755
MSTTLSGNTRKLVTQALLAAVAVVLVAFVHFPLIPSAPFLEYDPADIPIFIGAFLFGPWAGLGLTVVAAVIQGITVSASSGPIGIVMHILATGTFVILAGSIYQRRRTRRGAIMALVVGSLAMTVVMCLCNLVFTPLFMGSTVGDVIKMLIPAIIPFNLAKAGINSLVTYIVYKSVSRVVFKEKA